MRSTNRERLHEYTVKLRRQTGADPRLDGLWPAIQSRIEHRSWDALPARAPHVRRRARLVLGATAALAATAAAALAFTIAGTVRRNHARAPVVAVATARDSAATLRAIDDSVRAYQEETRMLLDRLEIARAVLPPQAARAVDHDLEVVDAAIAELNAAVARHPTDTSLRRLLAASYRQKRDVLERIENAG
jgi:hypothetical protein